MQNLPYGSQDTTCEETSLRIINPSQSDNWVPVTSELQRIRITELSVLNHLASLIPYNGNGCNSYENKYLCDGGIALVKLLDANNSGIASLIAEAASTTMTLQISSSSRPTLTVPPSPDHEPLISAILKINHGKLRHRNIVLNTPGHPPISSLVASRFFLNVIQIMCFQWYEPIIPSTDIRCPFRIHPKVLSHCTKLLLGVITPTSPTSYN